jgi:hypothetical protein
MLKPFRFDHVELTNRRLAFLAVHATASIQRSIASSKSPS